MTSCHDYYQILNVTASADTEVIKAAYRALAKKFHPDSSVTGGVPDAELFRRITEAYEVLIDPGRRKVYDESLSRRRTKTAAEEKSSTADCAEGMTDAEAELWRQAAELFPQLPIEYHRLTILSPPLGLQLQKALVTFREFKSATELANKLEGNFLKSTFGPSTEIQEAGRWCLSNGRGDVAAEILKLNSLFSKSLADSKLIAEANRNFKDVKLRKHMRSFRLDAAVHTAMGLTYFLIFGVPILISFGWRLGLIDLGITK